MPNYSKYQKVKIQEEKDNAVALYKEGLSMAAVAKKIKRSRTFVNDAIQAARVSGKL